MSYSVLYCETPRRIDRTDLDYLFADLAGYVRIKSYGQHRNHSGFFYLLQCRSDTAASRVVDAFNDDPHAFEPITKIKPDHFSVNPPPFRRSIEAAEHAARSRAQSPAAAARAAAAVSSSSSSPPPPSPPHPPVPARNDVARARVLASVDGVHKLFFAESAPTAPVPLLELTVRDADGKELQRMHLAAPLYEARSRPLCDAITRESFLCFDGAPPFVLSAGQAPLSSPPQ